MFKKLLLVFVLALATLSLTACDRGIEIDAADGVYTAFESGVHSNGTLQLTTVTITVKGGRIADYFIDCRQGSKTGTTEKPTNTFNAQTKKELAYQYGMHNADDADNDYVKQDLTTDAGLSAYKAYLKKTKQKEWFEQAEELEKYFFKNGPEAATIDDKKVFNTVAGVTIKDGSYTKLAKEAIKLAEEGKAQVVTIDGSSIIWVTAVVGDDGKFTDLELNTLQGKVGTDGKWAWNTESKQQLKYAYNMHNPKVDGVYTYDTTTTEGVTAYKAYLTSKGKFEWFEQANKLTDYVLANGVSGLKVKAEGTEGAGKLETTPEALTGVTVTADDYLKLFTDLYNNFK